MEVLLGPTFSIEVPPSSTAFVRAQKGASLPQDNPGAAVACLFMKGEEQEIQKNVGSGFGLLGSGSSLDDEDSSESSSSIGVPDDDSEDDAGEEVQSNLKEGGLCSLDSLEDSLPIKRGLSNHFSGKSKSFANLSEVIQVEDLKKPENPFNKRRRILMATKLSRKSSLYNWPNPKSMPLLVLNEDDEEEEEEEEPATGPSYSEEKEQQSDEEEERDSELRRRISKLHDRKLYSFKSRSCFDLQEYQK